MEVEKIRRMAEQVRGYIAAGSWDSANVRLSFVADQL